MFFCSSRIRTLVAMATFSSHRLIMGKEEIDNFFCLIGDIWIFFFTEMFIEFFVKMFKNLLLRNHIWDEAETWHTCLGH